MESKPNEEGGENEARQSNEQPQPKWDYHPASEPPHDKPRAQTGYEPKSLKWRYSRWRAPQVIVNGALAIITIIIAAIYYFELQEMKKTAKAATDAINQAERNSRLDQRAWVTVHSGKLSKPLEAGDVIVVDLSITNSGKTPAVNGRMFGLILSADPNNSFNTQFDPSKSGDNFTQFTIGPGRTDQVTAPQGPGIPIPQSDIDDIRNGKKCLFYIGHIFYDDVFGETHSTEFCAKMCTDLFESRAFVLCDHGNSQN